MPALPLLLRVHRPAVLRNPEQRALWARRAPHVVLLLGLLVNGGLLLRYSFGVWFWADDWDLLFLRGTIPQDNIGLLAPHNNHWLSAHIIVYRLIFSVFGMRSYTPYAAMEICMHLILVTVSYLVLRRVGTGAWVACVAALVLAFYGLGANAEIYAASMNHVGALLFALLAVLCVVSPAWDQRLLVRAALCTMVSLTFGLTALSGLVLIGIVTATRHGWRGAVRVLAMPCAVFVVWFFKYGTQGSANSIAPAQDMHANLAQIPSYVWTGLTGTLGDGSGLTGSGPLLVIGLVAAMALGSARPAPLLTLAWAGLVADLFQLTIVAVARFDFGPVQLGTSHYAYINMVLLTPAVAWAGTTIAGWVRQPRWQISVLVAAVFVAYAVNGVTWLQKWQRDFKLVSGGNEDFAIATAEVMKRHPRVLTDKNQDGFNALLIPRYLGTPQIRRALPDRTPPLEAVLNVDAQFFTGVGTKDYGLSRPSGIKPFSGFSPVRFAPGCHQYQPTVAEPILQIRTGVLGNEVVIWSNSTQVKTRVERGGKSSAVVTWGVKPGAVHVASNAQYSTLYASFNGTGSYTICIA